MTTNTESWDITDDESLRNAARFETQYDEETISTENVKGLVNSAKRVLALKAGVTSFYDDRGIAVALCGVLCAKMKGAVENSPVRVDSVGANDVTFRTSDGSSIQLGEYEDMTRLGLRESERTDAGPKGIELTATYLTGDPSRR